MFILIWLVFGAVVGWLASIVMKTNHRNGLISNILYGLIGSALGMWLIDIIGIGQVVTFSIEGLLVSVGGAVLFIAVLSSLRRN